MLNRYALRDCCIGCAGFGYALTTLPRLSTMVPSPHASRWPWFMDARRVLLKPECDELASNVHSDQIRACEKVCTPATIGGN